MGLLEKLKNTFFEEEYVEVEEKENKREEKKEKISKKIDDKPLERVVEERPVKIVEDLDEEEELEEIIEEDEEKPVEPIYSDRDLVNKNSKLTYFDDSDFEPTQSIPVIEKEEPKRVYGESAETLYNSIKVDDIKDYSNISHRAYGATEENKFEPTPIISPIYGILDKNYRKEEVIDRKDRPSSYVSRKNADLDSIRQKAYGIKEEVVEEEKKEPVLIEDEELPKPPTYDDMNYDYDIPAVDQVTVGDAEEYFNDLGLEYNIDYKDRHYENATGRRSDIYTQEKSNDLYDEVVINDNSIENDNSDDNITMDDLMSSQLKEIDQEEAHLEDNLFDLVDSLYEDGE